MKYLQDNLDNNLYWSYDVKEGLAYVFYTQTELYRELDNKISRRLNKLMLFEISITTVRI